MNAKRTRQTALPGFGTEEEEPAAAEAGALEDLLGNEVPSPVGAEGDAGDSGPRPGETVWVVDSHSLIHQVFHALPEMTSPQGRAGRGRVRLHPRPALSAGGEEARLSVLRLRLAGQDLSPRDVRAVQDSRGRKCPTTCVPQIPAIRRVIAALGIPALAASRSRPTTFWPPSLALTDEIAAAQCFLVTGDKDCRQLITDRVKVFNIRKNEVFDRAMLQAEWGVAPEQVVDFQALVGDSVDNVPGVPLIGPKFARQLLEQYGTLEAVLDHAGDVPGAKRKENLVKFRDQALLSRDLVRLDTRMSRSNIDWNAGRRGRIDVEAALALFHEFGFRSIGQRVESLATGDEGRGDEGRGKKDEW